MGPPAVVTPRSTSQRPCDGRRVMGPSPGRLDRRKSVPSGRERSRSACQPEILPATMVNGITSAPAPDALRTAQERRLRLAAIVLTAVTFAVLFAQPLANLVQTWWNSPDSG